MTDTNDRNEGAPTMNTVHAPAPEPGYAWSRVVGLPVVTAFMGRSDPRTVPTGAHFARGYADVAVRGRYFGICWR